MRRIDENVVGSEWTYLFPSLLPFSDHTLDGIPYLLCDGFWNASEPTYKPGRNHRSSYRLRNDSATLSHSSAIVETAKRDVLMRLDSLPFAHSFVGSYRICTSFHERMKGTHSGSKYASRLRQRKSVNPTTKAMQAKSKVTVGRESVEGEELIAKEGKWDSPYCPPYSSNTICMLRSLFHL